LRDEKEGAVETDEGDFEANVDMQRDKDFINVGVLGDSLLGKVFF
jgi:hypothetical protein